MRELYEAIGYAEGEVYEFPREVGIMVCCSSMVLVIFVTQLLILTMMLFSGF